MLASMNMQCEICKQDDWKNDEKHDTSLNEGFCRCAEQQTVEKANNISDANLVTSFENSDEALSKEIPQVTLKPDKLNNYYLNQEED